MVNCSLLAAALDATRGEWKRDGKDAGIWGGPSRDGRFQIGDGSERKAYRGNAFRSSFAVGLDQKAEFARFGIGYDGQLQRLMPPERIESYGVQRILNPIGGRGSGPTLFTGIG